MEGLGMACWIRRDRRYGFPPRFEEWGRLCAGTTIGGGLDFLVEYARRRVDALARGGLVFWQPVGLWSRNKVDQPVLGKNGGR